MTLNATSSKDIAKMSQSHFFRIKRDHLKARLISCPVIILKVMCITEYVVHKGTSLEFGWCIGRGVSKVDR